MAWHTALGLTPGPRTAVVHSKRASYEEFEHNLWFRWFLDMDLLECSFDATVFARNRARRLVHAAGRAMFDELMLAEHAKGLLSNAYSSVDGTLIEAVTSIKSFRPKNGPPSPATNDAPGHPSVDFRGTRRRHIPHAGTTDPEVRQRHKSRDRKAKLMFVDHALTGTATGCRWTSQAVGPTGMRNGRRYRSFWTRLVHAASIPGSEPPIWTMTRRLVRATCGIGT